LVSIIACNSSLREALISGYRFGVAARDTRRYG
jgi:hypothetical protein